MINDKIKEWLQGASPDAPVSENEQGGKQSSTPFATYLIGKECWPEIVEYFKDTPIYSIMKSTVGWFQNHVDIQSAKDVLKEVLYWRNKEITGEDTILPPVLALLDVSKRLEYGIHRYSRDNWLLITAEEHFNHLILHLWYDLLGDKQDDHQSAAVCRAMMFCELVLRENKPKGFIKYFDGKGYAIESTPSTPGSIAHEKIAKALHPLSGSVTEYDPFKSTKEKLGTLEPFSGSPCEETKQKIEESLKEEKQEEIDEIKPWWEKPVEP